MSLYNDIMVSYRCKRFESEEEMKAFVELQKHNILVVEAIHILADERVELENKGLLK